MKRAVTLFFVAVVGIIVFTGGLCIALGIRERESREQAPAEAGFVIPIFDIEEGSAI
ncbi:MAG: hypothetical protein Q4G52_01285 [Clostridia bacterium]|nr:hypothetical protein [Clostridia bacterium]